MKTSIGVQRELSQQANLARRLLSVSGPTQAMLDATVEITGVQPDVKYRASRYGELAFVRSKFSHFRFFILNKRYGDEYWHCSCGKNTAPCPHKRALQLHLEAQKEIDVA